MDNSRRPAGYFIAIIGVVGGTLLMPSFFLFFTVPGPLLLCALTLPLLIGIVRYRQARLDRHEPALPTRLRLYPSGQAGRKEWQEAPTQPPNRPLCLMNVDDQNGEWVGRKRPRRPVGTGGGVERMWGPGACPGTDEILLPHLGEVGPLKSHEDRHQAPSHPFSHPLSLQDGGGLVLVFPHSIGKIHQDGGGHPLVFPYSVVNIHQVGQTGGKGEEQTRTHAI